MWRRLPTHLHHHRPSLLLRPSGFAAPPPLLRRTPLVVSRYIASDSGSSVAPEKKTVEELYPIATGHERQELEAELQGKKLFEMDHPTGPFGTKEAPAIVKSRYDRRVVGCPGGEEEDEHDVVWFWLEKGKPVECPVCSQYFVLEVVGPGGDPDEEHHH